MIMGAEPFGQGAGGVDIVIHDKNALGLSGKPHARERRCMKVAVVSVARVHSHTVAKAGDVFSATDAVTASTRSTCSRKSGFCKVCQLR